MHAAACQPDADILGPEEYVESTSTIVDRVSIPVLVDGNAIDTIRLVREFEKVGADLVVHDDDFDPAMTERLYDVPLRLGNFHTVPCGGGDSTPVRFNDFLGPVGHNSVAARHSRTSTQGGRDDE